MGGRDEREGKGRGWVVLRVDCNGLRRKGWCVV